MTTKKSLLCAALALIGLSLAPRAFAAEPAAAAAEARAVVETFDAALLDAMKNARALKPAGRYQRLEPVMNATFDLRGMVEREAGSRWSHLSAEQKARLAAAYGAFEVAQYAVWFDVYAGQAFHIGGSRFVGDGLVSVSTVMSGGGIPALSLDYILKADDGNWRIVDIRYAGWYSEVERRRAEFTEVIEHSGVETLISRLDARREAALAQVDNAAAPHILQPRTDQWSLPVYPLN